MLKTIAANILGALLVFAVSVGLTLGVIYITGSWDTLAQLGADAHRLVEPDTYERTDKRGL